MIWFLLLTSLLVFDSLNGQSNACLTTIIDKLDSIALSAKANVTPSAVPNSERENDKSLNPLNPLNGKFADGAAMRPMTEHQKPNPRVLAD